MASLNRARRALPSVGLVGFLSLLGASFAARSDNFVEAHYDGGSDELVVTMRYRGTNPDHTFTIQWGTCQPASANSSSMQLSAAVLDSQWSDSARSPFRKVTRFSLAGVPCRPAVVTLHTAPRFYYQIMIPAAPR